MTSGSPCILPPLEQLEQINNLLEKNKDKVYFLWRGAKDESKAFFLLNKTYLIIAGWFNDQPKAFRFIGTIKQNKETGDKLYFAGGLVKIRSGKRAGIVVPTDQLYDDESVSFAGLQKLLTPHIIQNRQYLNIDKEQDKQFIDNVFNIIDTPAEEVNHILVPDFFILSRDDNNIKTRLNNLTLAYYENHGISSVQSVAPKDLAKQLPGTLITPCEDDVAYPYKYFYGKGLYTVSLNEKVLNTVYTIPKHLIDSQNYWSEVNIHTYMSDFK